MHEIKGSDYGTTRSAIEFFKRYKDAFGNVVSAKMKYDVPRNESEFILTNENRDIMYFKGECTAGYIGEGPNGTCRILKMAGFDVEEEFVHRNSSFELHK